MDRYSHNIKQMFYYFGKKKKTCICQLSTLRELAKHFSHLLIQEKIVSCFPFLTSQENLIHISCIFAGFASMFVFLILDHDEDIITHTIFSIIFCLQAVPSFGKLHGQQGD
ncbi:hypothetical protein ACJX0J_016516 [Zea mays]